MKNCLLTVFPLQVISLRVQSQLKDLDKKAFWSHEQEKTKSMNIFSPEHGQSNIVEVQIKGLDSQSLMLATHSSQGQNSHYTFLSMQAELEAYYHNYFKPLVLPTGCRNNGKIGSTQGVWRYCTGEKQRQLRKKGTQHVKSKIKYEKKNPL